MEGRKMETITIVSDTASIGTRALELALMVAGVTPQVQLDGAPGGHHPGLKIGTKVYGAYPGGLATLVRYAGRVAGLYPDDVAQALMVDEALGLMAADNLAALDAEFPVSGELLLGDKLSVVDVAIASFGKKLLSAFPNLTKVASRVKKDDRIAAALKQLDKK